MGYLATSARATSLTVGGIEYIQNLVEWVVSDSSAYGNGLITTAGICVLGSAPGVDLEDYDRNSFKRGNPVILRVQYPGNSSDVLHPRGTLYVVGINYEPELERLIVEIGCKLAMVSLLDDTDSLLADAIKPTIHLDPTGIAVQNISAAHQTTGHIVYQDGAGSLQKTEFFETLGSSWISVRDSTAISAAPLAGAAAIPDEIELSWQYNTTDPASDQQGRVDTAETISDYFLRYPYLTKVRIPEGTTDSGVVPDGELPPEDNYLVDYEGLGNVDDRVIAYPSLQDLIDANPNIYNPPSYVPSGACGNAPPPMPPSPDFPIVTNPNQPFFDEDGNPVDAPPGTNITIPGIDLDDVLGDILAGYTGAINDLYDDVNSPDPLTGAPTSCSDKYETRNQPLYVAARREENSRTEYDGPAAQVSFSQRDVQGPELEANQQYWADLYSFCVNANGTDCLPNGNCALVGLDTMELGKTETVSFYGDANELVRTVSNEYRPLLSAAQPSDWRSGVSNGVPQNFTEISTSKQYLHSIVTTQYKQEEDGSNVQITTTQTSIASRGAGILGGSVSRLDARKGIETKAVRRTATTLLDGTRPDTANAATTPTADESKKYRLSIGGGYEGSLFGPYVLKESVPVPLITELAEDQEDNEAEALQIANKYAENLIKHVKGDARGITVLELLREDMASDWKPNQPFRYWDGSKNFLGQFLMNATTWGVSPEACVVEPEGLGLGNMTGHVIVHPNLVGIDEEHPDGSELTPGSGVIECVDCGDLPDPFIFEVEVNFNFNLVANFNSDIHPGGQESSEVASSLVVWCTGYVAEPAGLISLNNDGSIPLSHVGGPVVYWNNIVNSDLFAEVVADEDETPNATWAITSNGSGAYLFTGEGHDGTVDNPTLTVVRGGTYIFTKANAAHPFQIQTVLGLSNSAYTDGITPENIQPLTDGTMTWVVPLDAPNTLHYQCTAHSVMQGTINVID